jgi:hypothetical protein
MPEHIRSLRPDRHELDRGAEHWRGGQVWVLGSPNSTIRILRAHVSQLVSNQTVVTSLIPSGAQSVGAPVCCRVDENFVIVEIIGSSFTAAEAPRGDNAASVARGVFSPGIVPREIHGEPETWWEEWRE